MKENIKYLYLTEFLIYILYFFIYFVLNNNNFTCYNEKITCNYISLVLHPFKLITSVTFIHILFIC
ncbi:hypothetical protein PFNF135_04598 [Plasmodium falciparum NF135/5.C10]|nr:hypothetical protein PFNF135_04598 [Plasmodium falciparum NF135/5.C10]